MLCRSHIDYFLASDGAANSKAGDGRLEPEPHGDAPPDVYPYDPLLPVPSLGGRSCCFDLVAPMGPADQDRVERRNDVLVYTSTPIERDLTVLGPVTATLYAVSTAPDTDFCVRLCRVGADGRSINIGEGIVRARFRESLSDPRPIEPNQVYEYRLDLGPTAIRIPVGERLRVQVTSSSFPHWDRNLNTGGPLGKEGPAAARIATQTILHDAAHPSRIRIPMLPE